MKISGQYLLANKNFSACALQFGISKSSACLDEEETEHMLEELKIPGASTRSIGELYDLNNHKLQKNCFILL